MRNQSLTGMIQFIPALEIVPKLMPKDATLAHSASLRTNYAAHQLRTHRETLDEDNPRDYIDAYLGAMAKRIRNKESTTFEGVCLFVAVKLLGTNVMALRIDFEF